MARCLFSINKLTKNKEMKIQEIIPKEIIEKYQIEQTEGTNDIDIHRNTYVNIEDAKVTESKSVFYLKNEKVCVTIWKEIHKIHVTVY